LELVAQEQVLDHKVVTLTEEGGQRREEDAEEFKHLGRVADRAGRSFALLHPQGFCVPRAGSRRLQSDDVSDEDGL